jgi:Putative metallopeptidase
MFRLLSGSADETHPKDLHGNMAGLLSCSIAIPENADLYNRGCRAEIRVNMRHRASGAPGGTIVKRNGGLSLLPKVLFALVAFPHASAASDARQDDIDAFISNTIIHIMHHEAGHALIDQFSLPVVGQEEDAVDGFATIAVLETYEEPLDVLVDAAAAWFAMHDLMLESGDEPTYFGEHDLDIQRAYRIICHAYGYDKATFEQVARDVALPDDRLETCEADSLQLLDGWESLLQDAYRAEGDTAGSMITFETDFKGASQLARNWLTETDVLGEIAEWLDATYAWPEPLKLVATSCGEANAFYDPEGPRLILCHEMIDFLGELAPTVVE